MSSSVIPEDGPRELLIEAPLSNLDEATFTILTERLREAGALEVERIPCQSGDGERLTIVRAVAPTELRGQIEEALIIHSTATSIRALPLDRLEIPVAVRSVTTRWGEVRLRLRVWRGRVLDASPIEADALTIARESEVPLALILGEATRLGDVFAGQHIDTE